MTGQQAAFDLSATLFLALRTAFFDAGGQPQTYQLRHKRNTQDDPFDESVCKLLSTALPADATCVKASGPLITPDLVVLRPALCDGASRSMLSTDLTRIVAVEVKKLERTAGGQVARASGLDFNTTPPCGTLRVYDQAGQPLDIRGFYLFVCQEPVPDQPNSYFLSALVLCDGNLLNADFEFYLSIVGERTKLVGLGTFGDGANRSRPMLIFANPLGAPALDRAVTLVHCRADLESDFPQLRRVGIIKRTVALGGTRVFHCYRLSGDVPADFSPIELLDPFPSPVRTERTQPRGRFRVGVRPAD